MKSQICGDTGKLKCTTREAAQWEKRHWSRATIFLCRACGTHHAAALPKAKGERSDLAIEAPA